MGRQVPHDGRPDFLEVDAEVVVYENVPHRGYLGPECVAGPASKRNGFLQNPIPDSGTKPTSDGDVDFATEEGFQLDNQRSVIEEAPPGLEIHEQIYVAIRRSLTPRHRSENAHVARPVGFRRAENRRPVLAEEFFDSHGCHSGRL